MPACGESSGHTSWRGQILRKVEKDMRIKKLLLPEILKFGEKIVSCISSNVDIRTI